MVNKKNLCAASLLQTNTNFNPFTTKFFGFFFLVFEYAKLCFEYKILRNKMTITFNWDTSFLVGVKRLKQDL